MDEPLAGVQQPSESWWREEEQASLQQSLRNLQTQFAAERAQRAESEREAELLAMENATLEQEVARMEVCQVGVRSIAQRLTAAAGRCSMTSCCTPDWS